MKNKFLIGLALCFLGISALFAQKKEEQKKLIEKNNQRLLTCIESNSTEWELLDDEFLFFQWAEQFQEYCREVVDEANNKVLIEISEQQHVVEELLLLGKSCKLLQDYKKELSKLKTLFDTKIKEKTHRQEGDNLSFQESRVVRLTVSDVRKMKLHVNAIVNKLKGDKSIFKIFR